MWPQYKNVQTISIDVVLEAYRSRERKKGHFTAQKYIDKILTLYGNVEAIVNQAHLHGWTWHITNWFIYLI